MHDVSVEILGLVGVHDVHQGWCASMTVDNIVMLDVNYGLKDAGRDLEQGLPIMVASLCANRKSLFNDDLFV